jgi:hypothetical protein
MPSPGGNCVFPLLLPLARAIIAAVNFAEFAGPRFPMGKDNGTAPNTEKRGVAL